MPVRAPDLGPRPLPPFTRDDLPGLGLSRHELDALLRAGRVVQPIRGTYLDARTAHDALARAQAVGRVLPAGAAVAGRTAAWLHGVDARAPGELDCTLPLECVVPVGVTPPRRRGLVARQATLPTHDITQHHGTPTTTAQRTAVDLSRSLSPFMALAVLDRLAASGAIRPEGVAARIEDFSGGRGVRQARRLVGLCDPRAESFGESWLRLRLADAGFPRPDLQIWMSDDEGVAVYRLDLGWPDRKIAVEYDGQAFHSAPEHRQRDVERRQRLAAEWGWHVIGVGRGEVLGRQLTLERGVGVLLGLEPLTRVRRW